ncbi:uncharacterized protein LOC128871718 isoform X2 [Anastrepha ludens]|uniref:uncharacterized protein LOC128871718 isoform X2 n=1 Tax=Anastrepha ludens TaxID=28586 RepID=UPI0023B15217|nr:uncharacterized protein LOC128871718 isoform X2 [Anastrepha ludens]
MRRRKEKRSKIIVKVYRVIDLVMEVPTTASNCFERQHIHVRPATYHPSDLIVRYCLRTPARLVLPKLFIYLARSVERQMNLLKLFGCS